MFDTLVPAVLPSRRPSILPVVDDLKKTWLKDGFVVMKSVFSADQIAKYNEVVDRVRSQVDDGKDAQGFGDRIGQLHQKERDLLTLPASPQIQKFLTWAFNQKPVLMGSLQFQKGTQQEAHIDAIFFWPEPSYSIAGVWVALEDIQVDAGPLFYIPGSHKWPFYRSEDVVRDDPELAARRRAAREGRLSAEEKGAVVSALGNAWTKKLIELESASPQKREPICLKAGDVVVWHSLLAHGGSPRLDQTKSRRSAVFHYFGKRAKIFTFEQFMLYDKADLLKQRATAPKVLSHMGIDYMKFPHFVTYSGGKEIVHPV
jgi:Phytanoyl-CoA dioxygenase (PhyH)